jgi:hypothetical protein
VETKIGITATIFVDMQHNSIVIDVQDNQFICVQHSSSFFADYVQRISNIPMMHSMAKIVLCCAE